VSVSRDKTDDKFIELAIDSGASILISGDPDLKDMKAYKGVEILSPAQFGVGANNESRKEPI
jgi:predicted nucleic acid-binding protein